MNDEQMALLKEIMAVDFALIEFNLYLDTHPCDTRALQEFNGLCQQSKALHMQYEQCYGPLKPCGANDRIPWSWIQMPWPWQIEYGRG